MTEQPRSPAAGSDLAEHAADLTEEGVRAVRLQFADLHGICRGKDIPASAFEAAADDGVSFVEATMTVDLKHHVIKGFERGFPDFVALPDMSTLIRIPWEPDVAACIVDLVHFGTHEPSDVDPRGALKRVLAQFSDLGLHPVIAAELEFYLFEPDASDPRGHCLYAAQDSGVYTTGAAADPKGTLSGMLDASVQYGLDPIAAAHEYGRSQYEINLRHGPALNSADRAFRYKHLVKELATRDGLLATFMGKPVNDDEGSGFHLHVSLADEEGNNRCADAEHPSGLADATRHFIAGLMEHAPAMMPFFNPTVNAYRRITPEALVPTRVCWGHDHRMVLVRVPQDRGAATRIELRLGDGTANVYLAYAAALAAGLDGIRRGLEPPDPIEGFLYDLPEDAQGPPLPASFDEALDALDRDEVIQAALGERLIAMFRDIKAAELERFRAWVTDWEFAEYSPRL